MFPSLPLIENKFTTDQRDKRRKKENKQQANKNPAKIKQTNKQAKQTNPSQLQQRKPLTPCMMCGKSSVVGEQQQKSPVHGETARGLYP